VAAASLVLGLVPACGTLRATGEWVVSPVAGAVLPENYRNEVCDRQPHRVAPLASIRRLRIGTWNMHYLGPSEETPDEKRDPRELAAYIRKSGVSVLALEEIGSDPTAANPRSPMLDAVFAELRRSGADWTYLLRGTDDDPDEFVGLAWDRRMVTQVDEALDLGLYDGSPGLLGIFPRTAIWRRPPFAVKLSAGQGLTDIVFIPVHLAARVEFYFFEDVTSHREEEAQLLAERLPSIRRHFQDRDVVVLGDFNSELATEKVNDALLERGLRDLNCADVTTFRLGTALDRVFVPDDQPEFALQPDFGTVTPDGVHSWGDYVDRYSDHLISVVEVLIGRDDD
jgi:endonuclease/exonuclease/phosphatase family metal-dependent hydrolase